jgi:hypothetical protein
MPSTITNHIRYAPLLRPEDEELTSAEASRIAGVSRERVRQWCIQHREIARWCPRLRMYVIRRSQFEALLARRRKGRLLFGLAQMWPW